jgi:hypothetical protein
VSVVSAAIEWGKLAEVIWVSLVAGVGVTATFSVVIYGSARAAEASRTGRSSAATAFGALAALAFLVFAAGLVFGVSTILNK